MIFVAATRDGGEIRYRDTKRYLWVLSTLTPLMPALSALALAWSGNPLFAVAALAFYYVLIPMLDMLVGKDTTNPPEEVVEQMADDPFYRRLLLVATAALWLNVLVVAGVLLTVSMPFWAVLMLVAASGVATGAGLTVSHELGHKQDKTDQIAAKLINALCGYAHFSIEHNRGHHVLVATAEDAASARLGDNVYTFAAREIPHVLVHGLQLEKARLAKKGLPFWHWRNDLLQGYAISLAMALVVIGLAGWVAIPLLVLHHGIAWFHLTQANFVEHYGLKRAQKDNGRYEPCQPHHSWNTNHIVSNLFLFHLQRHSDHHANPQRPYQSLRNFDELPHLPSGYPGTFLLAACPPLWHAVMDRKVYDWASGDIDKCNVRPGCEGFYADKFKQWANA